jgi:hyperosmotically inducible protein
VTGRKSKDSWPETGLPGWYGPCLLQGLEVEAAAGRAGIHIVAVKIHMGIRTRVLAMLMTVALGVPAMAAQGSVIERANYDVFKDVSSQVNRYVNFTVFDDVSASVVDGVVTLTGRVTMPYKRNDLERRVSNISGVRAVQNKIEVLPVSRFDDELRYRIARAIYGNPTFWHYAAMANPPIHIVVERGQVTLSGVVNSNVERALARSLATGFGEFSVKNELKTDAEMKDILEKM